jgi:putative peptidoglycan lipid II flippase
MSAQPVSEWRGVGTGPAPAVNVNPISAAGDSMTVAAWTMLSRITGLLRFAVIGAVLGPTFFGNTYQFTNSLPNLIYYGFLAGSLFSSLLVPALVGHIDAGDRRASERVAGGFLGATLVALAVIAPLAIGLGPQALRLASLGGGNSVPSGAQAQLGQLLILMFIPQVFLYGVVGTATAVMNSRRRFALAAGAPAVENLGTIAIIATAGLLYGSANSVTGVPAGEVLLLGFGSTAAVAAHAALQWWGARRAGVALRPAAGWRDPEVRAVMRRALPSVTQAGLMALQVLTLLVLANRLAGGVVAMQIALNFYYLAIALGATPVALALLPRLARLHVSDDRDAFRDTLTRGLALGLFVTIPAAAGYLALSVPLAHAVSFGRMDSAAGVTMIALALGAMAPAVVGQTVFMILTYASYARKDTRSPLMAMLLQAASCLVLAGIAVLVHGPALLLMLGLALSLSVGAGAAHLTRGMWRGLRGAGTVRLLPSVGRFLIAAAIMAGPAWTTARFLPSLLGRPAGIRIGVVAAALVGGAVFLALQGWWRTPELGWLAGGVGQFRRRSVRAVAGATNG